MPASIVYSVNHRLGGGGMGNSVLEMLVGLHQAGLLKQVMVSSSKTEQLPAHLITSMGVIGRLQKRLSLYDPTEWLLNYLESRIFDRWVSQIMPASPIFSSWTGICLTSLQKAKANGSTTFLGLGSAHPQDILTWLNVEYQQWGLSPQRFSPLMQQVSQELHLADKIIVQSHISQRSLIGQGIPAEKIIRLPLGVNVNRFKPASEPPTTPFRVLFLGQVMLRKGIQYLLEAWQLLGWRDAELWVVGRVMPDSQAVLERYANLPGLKLQGYVPDQLAAFQQAQVFVAPSVEDGFGLTVVEAMACGLPVIVSDHTGAADLVQHGESGFIVPYNSPVGYASALQILRDHPRLAKKMGQAAQAIAQQQTWDVYRQKLVDLMRSHEP